MNLNVPDRSELTLRLRDHQIFSIPDAAGMSLECLAGGVWLTFDGDRADHFLKPGERFQVAAGGQAVIQALEDSEVALMADAGGPHGGGGLAPAGACAPLAKAPFFRAPGTTAGEPTDGWRNIIASLSASRLGLERTF